MTLIAYAFPKFQTARGVVGYMTKKLHFKTPSDRQYAKVSLFFFLLNTCHQQSICYQTVLRFQISTAETFSNSISLRGTKKYDKSALMQILSVLRIL